MLFFVVASVAREKFSSLLVKLTYSFLVVFNNFKVMLLSTTLQQQLYYYYYYY